MTDDSKPPTNLATYRNRRAAEQMRDTMHREDGGHWSAVICPCEQSLFWLCSECGIQKVYCFRGETPCEHAIELLGLDVS